MVIKLVEETRRVCFRVRLCLLEQRYIPVMVPRFPNASGLGDLDSLWWASLSASDEKCNRMQKKMKENSSFCFYHHYRQWFVCSFLQNKGSLLFSYGCEEIAWDEVRRRIELSYVWMSREKAYLSSKVYKTKMDIFKISEGEFPKHIFYFLIHQP